MPVELHRCANTWMKFGPCWRVQKALDERHVAYEVVTVPWRPRNRAVVIAGTGQPLYPSLRFEDDTWYRDESREMARVIREGRLPELQPHAQA